MSSSETRALSVAAGVLLLASAFRYGLDVARGAAPVSPDSSTVLEDLRAASLRKATQEEERRRPLASGETVDPNRASELQLDRLPGIGPATARRIVEEREERGGFWSPADLARVRGIGPATVERIRRHLDLGGGVPAALRRPPATRAEEGDARGQGARRPEPGAGSAGTPLDLNRATEEELVRLPGVGPAIARRIVDRRSSRGPFRSVEEVTQVRGIGPATLERLRRLVRVRPR